MRRSLIASVALHGALVAGGIGLAALAAPDASLRAEVTWLPQQSSSPAPWVDHRPREEAMAEHGEAPPLVEPRLEPPVDDLQPEPEEVLDTTPAAEDLWRRLLPEFALRRITPPRADTEQADTAQPEPAEAAPTPAPPSPHVEAEPLRTENAPPIYPRRARRLGHQGEVWLEVVVDRSGQPRSVAIHRACRHPELNREALRAVRDWRFMPARRNGEPVESTLRFPIIFRLEEERTTPTGGRRRR